MNLNKVATSRMGMWHRPFEHDINEVQQTLKELHDLGITDLFVETYFNGQLIMDSPHALLSKHAFVGTYAAYGSNLLDAFVQEGKRYGIHIHAWVENFFVGRFENVEDSMWYHHYPEWILKNRDGTWLQKNEVNYLFLDPANPKVTQYTYHLYQDILSVNGLESLHLDYIRYPLMYNITPPMIGDDVGYTDYGLNEFAKCYSIQGSLIDQIAKPEIYQKWCQFRIGIIDDFVEKIFALSQTKQIGLSAAVFGNPDHAMKHKMQDWNTWLQKGWLYLILPMAYYKDQIRVYDEVYQMKQRIPHGVLLMAGIAPFMMHLSDVEHKAQVRASLQAGADGVAMFASQHYLSHHQMEKNIDYKAIHQMFKDMYQEDNTHETLD
ncbi:MAG: hypothetical protein C4537_03540 [Acholeplasma sp.]|jgi:uncharacterized lipoprotein YddW (UPF0748 family)|nr:MAG: hypothetical protein C4537_03540 [Acholeplasma sp.]